METIAIQGYEKNGTCEHCGRSLIHCIRIDDGRLVGATCFDKILTKPRRYFGKAYRIGQENVIRLAKMAANGKMSSDQRYRLTFEKA